jgi:hypothetical protein
LGGTKFANTKLIDLVGLEFCEHERPSEIDIGTIMRSGGSIPTAFVRNCGAPDSLIQGAASIRGSASQFSSCFIGYSNVDKPFVEKLNADLRTMKIPCWFAPEDLKSGDRFTECIEDCIRDFDKVMVVLSAASILSRWVEREVLAAREREDRQGGTVLLPITIDDTIHHAPQPWAAEIAGDSHSRPAC